ncbi:Interferon-induced very large GTPase 1, partial [Calypte anna]
CFQISCQGATSVTTFSVFLCEKIAPALRRAVYNKTALKIAEVMQDDVSDFKSNRRSLEVHILKYLAKQQNFSLYKEYISFPESFTKNYIHRRVQEYCFGENQRLKQLLEKSLSFYCDCLHTAVFTSTDIVRDRTDRADKISLWLDQFCSKLGEVLNLPRSDLKAIEHQEVTDMEFLNNTMTQALDDLRNEIKKGFASANLSSFENQPHTILATHFSGCWEKCPFCGAVCTNNMRNHDGDHQVIYHRPEALVGGWWYQTENLVIDICSSSVASDCRFLHHEKGWIPYKKYRDAGPPYSSWNIPPDPSMQAYWKWFVSHFRTDLEQWYKKKFRGRGEIPLEWTRIQKEEALRELEK